jgi:hypothetical protein
MDGDVLGAVRVPGQDTSEMRGRGARASRDSSVIEIMQCTAPKLEGQVLVWRCLCRTRAAAAADTKDPAKLFQFTTTSPRSVTWPYSSYLFS